MFENYSEPVDRDKHSNGIFRKALIIGWNFTKNLKNSQKIGKETPWKPWIWEKIFVRHPAQYLLFPGIKNGGNRDFVRRSYITTVQIVQTVQITVLWKCIRGLNKNIQMHKTNGDSYQELI